MDALSFALKCGVIAGFSECKGRKWGLLTAHVGMQRMAEQKTKREVKVRYRKGKSSVHTCA